MRKLARRLLGWGQVSGLCWQAENHPPKPGLGLKNRKRALSATAKVLAHLARCPRCLAAPSLLRAGGHWPRCPAWPFFALQLRVHQRLVNLKYRHKNTHHSKNADFDHALIKPRAAAFF